MKITKMLLLFVVGVCSVYSQVQQEWVVRYNGPGNGFDFGGSLISDDSGKIYVAGKSAVNDSLSEMIVIKYSNDGVQEWVATYLGPNDKNNITNSIIIANDNFIYAVGTSFNSISNHDIVTIKIDQYGQIIWIKRYDYNLSNEYGYHILTDSLNNIFVSGRRGGDIVLIKYNSEGETQWVADYNGNANGFDAVYSMKQDNSGNLYLAGSTELSPVNSDGLILKYSKVGELIWARTFNIPGNYDEMFYSMILDEENNCYATGEIFYTPFDSDCSIIRIDSSGSLVWSKIYNGPANDIDMGTHIDLDKMGNVVIAGQSLGTSNANNYLIIKYSVEGELQWVKMFEGLENDIISDLAIDGYGDIYVTGSHWNSQIVDYLTVKYNSNGEMIWQKIYNGPDNHQDSPTSLIVDQYLNVYVTGFSRGINSSHDIATIKYSQIIGIIPISTEIPGKFSLFQNYPNPFNSVTNFGFRIANFGFVSIKIYDISGQEVAVVVNGQLNPGTYEVNWDASAYPSGVYFYKLSVRQTGSSTGDYSETKKMMLIK